MWLSPLFERFVENSPVTVIVRTLMEVILAEEKLDRVFAQTAQTGYTREILFSTLVNMMIQVVCSVRQSIGAVYQAMAGELGVSKAAVYGKLNRLEPRVSQALVRTTAEELGHLVGQVGGQYCSVKNLGLSDEKAEEQGERSRERGFWFSPLHPAPRSPAVLTENFVLTEQY
jgi:hypothetical protein